MKLWRSACVFATGCAVLTLVPSCTKDVPRAPSPAQVAQEARIAELRNQSSRAVHAEVDALTGAVVRLRGRFTAAPADRPTGAHSFLSRNAEAFKVRGDLGDLRLAHDARGILVPDVHVQPLAGHYPVGHVLVHRLIATEGIEEAAAQRERPDGSQRGGQADCHGAGADHTRALRTDGRRIEGGRDRGHGRGSQIINSPVVP